MKTRELLRPAWVEIDLRQLRRNFDLIHRDRPPGVRVLSVVKDNAYGHGALAVARAGLAAGNSYLAVSNVQEGLDLRQGGITAPVLAFGERLPEEVEYCLRHDLACTVADAETARLFSSIALRIGEPLKVHLKIDTGMSRYGLRWSHAEEFVERVRGFPNLRFAGAMTHFAMSDEKDKSFALLQLSRFQEALGILAKKGLDDLLRHACNSGGFLDLPMAHLDMVRLGILPLGVYPSKVCRRIPGIQPVMTVKARIAFIRDFLPGDKLGYGMHFESKTPRRIAIIPVGYGDGFPRVRNEGHVLVHGRRAPLAGGVSMDAIAVDVTEIPEARQWDEVVLMGRQGNEEINAHDLAALKRSVSYDVLTGWRSRLPRVYLE